MRQMLAPLTTLLSLLLIGLLAFLAIRGMLDPEAGAAAFGLEAADPSAAFYHAVYRDRNLVLAVIGLTYLFARMWRALAILSTVSLTLPLYDMAALSTADVPIVAVHPVTLAALVVLSTALWLRVLHEKPAP